MGERGVDQRAGRRDRRRGRAGAGPAARSRRWAPGGTPCATPGAAPDLTRELGEHRRDPVGGGAGCGREPFADLALDHDDPLRARRGARRSCAGSRWPRSRREGWPRPCPAAGRSAARSSSSASAKCSETLSKRLQRLAQAALEALVDLDHVQVRDARGQTRRTARRGPRRSPARRRSGVELRQPLDHVEDVAVDQEVLAELALARRAALLTIRTRPPRCVDRPLQLGVGDAPLHRDRLRGGDDVRGLVGLAAHRLGRQVGRVGLDQQPLGGTRSAASRRPRRWGRWRCRRRRATSARGRGTPRTRLGHREAVQDHPQPSAARVEHRRACRRRRRGCG